MNNFYFNMIRRIRLLSVRNTCNAFFTQRAAFLPKQNLMEFCFASNPDILKNKNSNEHQVSAHNVPDEPLLKYTILKEIFKGNLKTNFSDPCEREVQLKVFLHDVVKYPATDIIKLLKIFAENNNRALLILKTLCDILVTKNEEFTEWECSDLLYSLAKMTFKYEPAIKLVENQLKKKKKFQSVSAIKSILHSFAELKYRNCELFESMLQYMISYSKDVKTIAEVLISFSYLNFSHPQLDHLIKDLAELESFDFPQTKDYINFIWSSVILNRLSILPERHLIHILSPSFLEQLEKGMTGVHPRYKLKLLQINTAASQLPSYKGPLLNDLPQFKVWHPTLSGKATVFMESLKDSFSYIVPKNGQMDFFVNTGTGFFIDIEFLLDKKSWPVPIKTKSDTVKVGVILLHYCDLCMDNTPTGVTAFKLNVLKRQGHNLLVIPYHEYPLNSKLSEKIFYLRGKIKDVGKESENSGIEKN